MACIHWRRNSFLTLPSALFHSISYFWHLILASLSVSLFDSFVILEWGFYHYLVITGVIVLMQINWVSLSFEMATFDNFVSYTESYMIDFSYL